MNKGRRAIVEAKQALEQQRLGRSCQYNIGMPKDADDTIPSMHGDDGEATLKGIIELVRKGYLLLHKKENSTTIMASSWPN